MTRLNKIPQVAKTYAEVAKQYNLPETMAKRYVQYMTTRWAQDEALNCRCFYAQEWAERFLAGREYTASDSYGQSVLRGIDTVSAPDEK